MKIVAVLLLRDSKVVNKYGFSEYRPVGNLNATLKRLDELEVDEIVILNKTHSSNPIEDFQEIWKSQIVGSGLSTSLAYGGGIRSVQNAMEIIKAGAERVVLSSKPEVLELSKSIAETFGEQSLIFHVPYKSKECGYFLANSSSSRQISDFVAELPKPFGGEIILTSVSHEGERKVNFKEVEHIKSKFFYDVNVVYNGGVVKMDDILKLAKFNLNGIGLGNILNSRELFIPKLKLNLPSITRSLDTGIYDDAL